MAKHHFALLALLLCFVTAAFAGTATLSFSQTSPFWGQMQRITFKLDENIASTLTLTTTTPGSGRIFLSEFTSLYCFTGSQIVSAYSITSTNVDSIKIDITPSSKTGIAANTEFYCDFRITTQAFAATELTFALSTVSTAHTIEYSGNKMAVPTIAQFSVSNFSASSSTGNALAATVPFGINLKILQQIGYLTVEYKALPPNMLCPVDVTVEVAPGENVSLLTDLDSALTDIYLSGLWDWIKTYPSQDVKLHLSTDNKLYLLTGSAPADGSFNIPFPTDTIFAQYGINRGEAWITVGPVGMNVQTPGGSRYQNGMLDLFDLIPRGVITVSPSDSLMAIGATTVTTAMTLIALEDITSMDEVETSLTISVSGDENVTFEKLIGTDGKASCQYTFQGDLSQSVSSNPLSKYITSSAMSLQDMRAQQLENIVPLDPTKNSYDVNYAKAAFIGIVLCQFSPGEDFSQYDFSIKISFGKYSQTYISQTRLPASLQHVDSGIPDAKITAGSMAFDLAFTPDFFSEADMPEVTRVDSAVNLTPQNSFDIRSPSAPTPTCTTTTAGITITTGKVEYPNMSAFHTSSMKLEGFVKKADFPIKLSCTQAISASPVPAHYPFSVTVRSFVGFSATQTMGIAVPVGDEAETFSGKTVFTITTSMPLTSQADLDAVLTTFVGIVTGYEDFTDATIDDVLVSSIATQVSDPYIFNPFDQSVLITGLSANVNSVEVWLSLPATAPGLYSAMDGSFNAQFRSANLDAFKSTVVFPSNTAASFFYATNQHLECYSNANCEAAPSNRYFNNPLGLCWQGKCISSFDEIPFTEYPNIDAVLRNGAYAVTTEMTNASSYAVLSQILVISIAIVVTLM